MKKYVLYCVDFLINTNIYIALAAAFLTIETQIQLGLNPQIHPYLFIIFFSTLIEYNFPKLITFFKRNYIIDKTKTRKAVRNIELLLFIVSAAGLFSAIFFATNDIILSLLPFALITFLYSFPTAFKVFFLIPLRNVPFLKIFLISLVWSAVTIFLPLIQSGKSFLPGHIISMFVERFVFIFAITLPFDVRDMMRDRESGLKTIPLLIGEYKSYLASNVCLVIFFVLCLFHYLHGNLSFLFPAFAISSVLTLIALNSNTLKKKYFYHYFILDGTMLIQGLLSFICYYLHSNFFWLNV